MRASKLNLGILLLPATSAYDLRGYAHHLHPRSFAPSGGTVAPSGGTAPYGLGNGTSTFGSSGLLATAGMSTRTSQVHVTVPGGTVYHTVSASGVHEPYGSSAATGVGSSCTQATVTHRVNTTFYVTEYGSGGASSEFPGISCQGLSVQRSLTGALFSQYPILELISGFSSSCDQLSPCSHSHSFR